MTTDEIRALLGPYDLPHLECDGATRVFAWLLKQNDVPYVVKCGRLEFGGRVVDYKARMWLPGVDGVPHGVFDPCDYPKALYVGEEDRGVLVTKTMFNVLTRVCERRGA